MFIKMKNLIELAARTVPLESLKPYQRRARSHSKAQIRKLADAMRTTRVIAPIIVDDDGVVLAGYARLEAAKLLGLTELEARALW